MTSLRGSFGGGSASRYRGFVLAIALLTGIQAAWPVPVRAGPPETVTFTFPASVTFQVASGGAIVGVPNPTHISFSNAKLNSGRRLCIAAKPINGAFYFSPGTAMWTNWVTLTPSNVSGGTAFSSPLYYTGALVYRSVYDPSAGAFDVTWTLNNPGGVPAGTYTVGVEWSLYSVGC